jgi:cytochrome c551/c552
LKTMTISKSTSLAVMALAVYFISGCSSKEDRDKYDHYYGSGSKSREETALVELANDRKNQPATPAVAPAAPAAAPATGDSSASAGDSTSNTTAIGSGGAAAAATEPTASAAPSKRKPVPADVSALLNKHACFACHQAYDKVIGPAYSDVAKKKYSTDEIIALVHSPKPEHWPGFPPMAPMPHVPKADIVVIANWINSL